MNYINILAGGVGSRFWPLSSELEPKQFLNICSSKPMLQECLCRIKGLVPKENIFIATSNAHKDRMKSCLKGLGVPLGNIFFEPQGKSTLAPIALFSKRIINKDRDANIVVLPCDHYVRNNRKFLEALSNGLRAAQLGYIVTLGFPPIRPETGYGYIKINSESKTKNQKFYEVERFIEKPKLKKALRFLKDKSYLWNGGIFIFRADVMLDEIKRLKPKVYKTIMAMGDKKRFNRLWQDLPAISIDYAIMEKTKKSVLVKADYGWLDLGSWQAVEGILKKDKCGNIFKGNCLDLGSRNTLVWSEGQTIATIGLKNTVVVATKEAVLVCPKDKTQDVKKIVSLLKKKKAG